MSDGIRSLDSEWLYRGKVVSLRRDTLQMDDGARRRARDRRSPGRGRRGRDRRRRPHRAGEPVPARGPRPAGRAARRAARRRRRATARGRPPRTGRGGVACRPATGRCCSTCTPRPGSPTRRSGSSWPASCARRAVPTASSSRREEVEHDGVTACRWTRRRRSACSPARSPTPPRSPGSWPLPSPARTRWGGLRAADAPWPARQAEDA